MSDVYDNFQVTIIYECDADYLTLSTQIGNWIYFLDTPAETKYFPPTSFVDGCDYSMVC